MCSKSKNKLNTRNEEWERDPVCTSIVEERKPLAGGKSSIKSEGVKGLREVGRKSQKCLDPQECPTCSPQVACGPGWL